MKSKIGKKVVVHKGEGVIVGVDLPQSRVPRFIVLLDDQFRTSKTEWLDHRLCYFPEEVKFI